ncbi:MAG: CHASE domain-containing protein [Methylophilaceae bacterium]
MTVLGFYLAGRLSISLGIGADGISIIWLPSGIALLAALAWGYPGIIGTFIGAFLLQLYGWLTPSFPNFNMLHQTVPLALILAIGGTFEATLSRYWIQHFIADFNFNRLRQIVAFVTLTLISCFINSAISSVALDYFDVISHEAVSYTLITFWIGNLCGVLLIVPAGLAIIRDKGNIRNIIFYGLPIIGLGLSLTFMATYLAFQLDRKTKIKEFTHASELAASEIKSTLELGIRDIATLPALFYKTEIKRNEFVNSALPLLSRNGFVTKLSWIPRVPAQQRIAFEQLAKQQGLNDFYIFEMSPARGRIPPKPRDEYFPLFYIATSSDEQLNYGFDAGSEPMRMAAINAAMTLGVESGTAPIKLMQDRQRLNTMNVYWPVYRGAFEEDTSKKLPENVRGLIAASFSLDHMVEDALKQLPPAKFETLMFDITSPDQLIGLTSIQEIPQNASLASLRNGLFTEKILHVAGRSWLIHIRPSKNSGLMTPPLVPVAVFLIGLGFTLLIAMHILARRRHEKLAHDNELRLASQNQCLAQLTKKYALAGEVTASFEEITEAIADSLMVDRVSVWMFEQNKSMLVTKRLFQRQSRSHESGMTIMEFDYPIYFANIKTASIIDASDANEDLRTREFSSNYLKPMGIGAMLDIPIFGGGELIGVLCLEHVGGKRTWTTDEKTFSEALRSLITLSIESRARRQAQTLLELANADLEQKVALRTQDMEAANNHLREEVIERRNAETQLKVFQLFANDATQGLLIATFDRAIRYANPSLLKLLQLDNAEQIVSSDLVAYFTDADQAKLHEAVLPAINTQGQWSGELNLRCPDDSYRPVYASIFDLHDEQDNPTYIACILADITAQKEMERQLLSAKASAEAADRAKSMFIASMSHELRTPLNSIIGFSSVILQGISGEINQRQSDQLGRVLGSAKHLLNLITDVIDISKIEAGYTDIHCEDFELFKVIDEAVATIHNQRKEKGIALILDVDQHIQLHTDRKRTFQCVLNLVSNAVKYSEQGTITINAARVGDKVMISVADTGIGISAEAQARLFMPFERIDTHLRVKNPGTGLGLYLTRKITQEFLHGEITMTSVDGKGSVFTIEIPQTNPNKK